MTAWPQVAFAQFADGLFNDAAERLRAAIAPGLRPFFLTHSMFGSGAIERLERMPNLKRAALDILTSKHALDPQMFAPYILLAFAFSNNPGRPEGADHELEAHPLQVVQLPIAGTLRIAS